MSPKITTKKKESLWTSAHARLKPELDALPAADVCTVNANVPDTVGIVLRSLPRLRALGPALTKALPTFDQSLFDKLENCAHALAMTHANQLAARAPAVPNDAIERAAALRKILRADAQALCARGYLSETKLSQVSGRVGYQNTSEDLTLLAATLGAILPAVQGKSAVSAPDLELAMELAAQLRFAERRRNGVSLSEASAIDARNRAFTLLSKTYAEVRPAIVYLRAAEGDASVLMPGLFGRPGASKTSLRVTTHRRA